MTAHRKSLAGRVLKRAFALLALLLLLPYLWGPVYDFPPAEPFSGSHVLNPYDRLTGRWQRANLHAHGRAWRGLTNGAQTSDRVIRRYHAAGYQVAGVSNYHSIAARQGFDTIPIYEHGYNLWKHHQLAIGAERVDWFDFPLWQSVSHEQFVIDRLRRSTAIIALAHPPSRNAYAPAEMRKLTGYHVLEILNGPFHSVEAWDAALSSGRAVWAIGNDDTHDIDDVRRSMVAWTMIDAPSAATGDIVAALEAGRTYAVARTNELATPIDTTLAAVRVDAGRLMVSATGEPSTFRFIGQNGAVRKTVKGTLEADYTLAPADTYIRTEIRSPRTTMYLNPVLRYDGATLPAPAAVVNGGKTWLWRAAASLALVAGVLIVRRRRTVKGVPAPRPMLAEEARRKTA